MQGGGRAAKSLLPSPPRGTRDEGRHSFWTIAYNPSISSSSSSLALSAGILRQNMASSQIVFLQFAYASHFSPPIDNLHREGLRKHLQ